MNRSDIRAFAAVVLVASGIAACDKAPITTPDNSPLAGLSKSEVHDTSNAAHSPTGTGPGYFKGTVLAPALPGAGNDSLNTAPRIAGVVVTIYERDVTKDEGVAVGDAKGSVTTGADGKFQLPTLPAGEYIVTFVPPANSGYHGTYAFGPLYATSSDFPWWIVLAKKQ
jgi:hypothetical protein